MSVGNGAAMRNCKYHPRACMVSLQVNNRLLKMPLFTNRRNWRWTMVWIPGLLRCAACCLGALVLAMKGIVRKTKWHWLGSAAQRCQIHLHHLLGDDSMNRHNNAMWCLTSSKGIGSSLLKDVISTLVVHECR